MPSPPKPSPLLSQLPFLPCQIDMCLLHDSQPGQQRLQVTLTGHIVIQGLVQQNPEINLSVLCWLYPTLAWFDLCRTHSNDLGIQFSWQGWWRRLDSKETMEGVHGTCCYQLGVKGNKNPYAAHTYTWPHKPINHNPSIYPKGTEKVLPSSTDKKQHTQPKPQHWLHEQ